MYAYLLEIDAWTGSAVETLRLASRTIVTSPTDTPAHTLYRGLIVDAGSVSRSISVSSAGLIGGQEGYGFLELNNADGVLDAWLDYGFDGRPFRLKVLPDGYTKVSDATLLFRGSLSGIDSSDAMRVLRLRIRDRLAELSTPLLTTRYSGTTISGGLASAEGDETMAGQIKPRIWGTVFHVPGKLVNKFDLLYQFSSHEVESIVVFDGGLQLSNVGNYSTLFALLGATLVPGQYATCLSQGIARLGGAVIFVVTANVVEGHLITQRSAARVAKSMLTAFGIASVDIDGASFDDLHDANNGEVGIYLADDTMALDAISRVLNSVQAALVPTALGSFQVVQLTDPDGVPVTTLTQYDLSGSGLGISSGHGADVQPAWFVELTYARAWQTLSVGEMAGAVPADVSVFIQAETRSATAGDSTVKTKHLLASKLTHDSLFAFKADAEAEASRRLELYGQRRDLLTLPIPHERGQIELGEIVEVDLPRFGYRGGELFVVTGREDNFDDEIITLTLWG
jgi:hypothetical protein